VFRSGGFQGGARTAASPAVTALMALAVVTLSTRVMPALPRGEQGAKAFQGLDKDLHQAMISNNTTEAIKAVDALAATGDPAAIDIIIKQALTGVNYEVEKHAGAILAGTSEPKIRERVYEGIRKNSNHRTRIVLIAVAARIADDPAAMTAIHGAVKDPSKAVALSALQWIRKIGRKDSIEPLIAELQARQAKALDRVYFDIEKTLRVLTGAELDAAVDWQNYWDARKRGVAQPAAKKSRGRTEVAHRDSFFSVMVDSDSVLFVIDVSESMTVRDPFQEAPAKKEDDHRGVTVAPKKEERKDGTTVKPAASLPMERQRLYRVKEELIRVVSGLQSTTRFGILSFNHEFKYLWDARVLKNATPEAKAAAVSWVKSLTASGATRTDLVLKEALSIPDVDTIFLLTDGAPKDERNQRLPIEPILALAKEQNRFVRARINTISFQQIRDAKMRTFVRELAQQNDGGEPTWLP